MGRKSNELCSILCNKQTVAFKDAETVNSKVGTRQDVFSANTKKEV